VLNEKWKELEAKVALKDELEKQIIDL